MAFVMSASMFIEHLSRRAIGSPVDMVMIDYNDRGQDELSLVSFASYLNARSVTWIIGAQKSIERMLQLREGILNVTFHMVSERIYVAPFDHKIIAFDVETSKGRELNLNVTWDDKSEPVHWSAQSLDNLHVLFTVLPCKEELYSSSSQHCINMAEKHLGLG